METDLLPNVRGNVQTLRNMWITKEQEDKNLLKPKTVSYRSKVQITPSKPSIKINIQSPTSIDETEIKKESTVTFDNAGKKNKYNEMAMIDL
jgi:hypothetical protein